MPMFRKKPVVVYARQTKEVEHITTLEGTMRAEPGDWIIAGAKGPCKPDIFEQTYERVGDLIPAKDSGEKTMSTRTADKKNPTVYEQCVTIERWLDKERTRRLHYLAKYSDDVLNRITQDGLIESVEAEGAQMLRDTAEGPEPSFHGVPEGENDPGLPEGTPEQR